MLIPRDFALSGFSFNCSFPSFMDSDIGHDPIFIFTQKSLLGHKSISKQCSLYRRYCKGDNEGQERGLANNFKIPTAELRTKLLLYLAGHSGSCLQS